MPRPKRDDPEQSKRFIETAREHGATDAKASDRALHAVLAAKKPPAK
jgi:hypothetical protein